MSRKREVNDERVPESPPVAEDRLEKVRRRAYELWAQSGYEHGHDVEHWLAAEREVDGPGE